MINKKKNKKKQSCLASVFKCEQSRVVKVQSALEKVVGWGWGVRGGGAGGVRVTRFLSPCLDDK